MQDIMVRVARPDEEPAGLALLPPVVGPEMQLLTARDGDGVLLGAAGLGWRGWRKPPGFPLWVHVLPDARRRGVGTALARAAIALARGEADLLWTARTLVEGQAAAAFATSLGFTTVVRRFFFETPTAPFLTHMSAIVERLERRDRIPEGARLIGLEDAPRGEVADLVARELDSASPRIVEMMERALAEPPATAPLDRMRSRVLMVGDRLAGALLSKRLPDGRSMVVCNVVAPGWRGGWPNALLLHATTVAGSDDGCPAFAFDCDDTVRDTINLAARAGADHVRTEVAMRYALTA